MVVKANALLSGAHVGCMSSPRVYVRRRSWPPRSNSTMSSTPLSGTMRLSVHPRPSGRATSSNNKPPVDGILQRGRLERLTSSKPMPAQCDPSTGTSYNSNVDLLADNRSATSTASGLTVGRARTHAAAPAMLDIATIESGGGYGPRSSERVSSPNHPWQRPNEQRDETVRRRRAEQVARELVGLMSACDGVDRTSISYTRVNVGDVVRTHEQWRRHAHFSRIRIRVVGDRSSDGARPQRGIRSSEAPSRTAAACSSCTVVQPASCRTTNPRCSSLASGPSISLVVCDAAAASRDFESDTPPVASTRSSSRSFASRLSTRRRTALPSVNAANRASGSADCQKRSDSLPASDECVCASSPRSSISCSVSSTRSGDPPAAAPSAAGNRSAHGSSGRRAILEMSDATSSSASG